MLATNTTYKAQQFQQATVKQTYSTGVVTVTVKLKATGSRLSVKPAPKKLDTLTIAGNKAAVNTHGFRIKTSKKNFLRSYLPLQLAKKNQKFSVTLTRYDWTGFCSISCVRFTEIIKLKKNGTFDWFSTYDNGDWVVTPPNDLGTYRVLSTGRVELRYKDKTKKKKLLTLGIGYDMLGKPNPKAAGLMIGDRNFYPQD